MYKLLSPCGYICYFLQKTLTVKYCFVTQSQSSIQIGDWYCCCQALKCLENLKKPSDQTEIFVTVKIINKIITMISEFKEILDFRPPETVCYFVMYCTASIESSQRMWQTKNRPHMLLTIYLRVQDMTGIILHNIFQIFMCYLFIGIKINNYNLV